MWVQTVVFPKVHECEQMIVLHLERSGSDCEREIGVRGNISISSSSWPRAVVNSRSLSSHNLRRTARLGVSFLIVFAASCGNDWLGAIDGMSSSCSSLEEEQGEEDEDENGEDEEDGGVEDVLERSGEDAGSVSAEALAEREVEHPSTS